MIVSNMTMTPDRNLKAAFVGPDFISGKAFLTKRSSIAQARELPDINNPQFTFVALRDSTSESVIREERPASQTADNGHTERRYPDGHRRQGGRHDRRLSHLHRRDHSETRPQDCFPL